MRPIAIGNDVSMTVDEWAENAGPWVIEEAVHFGKLTFSGHVQVTFTRISNFQPTSRRFNLLDESSTAPASSGKMIGLRRTTNDLMIQRSDYDAASWNAQTAFTGFVTLKSRGLLSRAPS